MKQKSLLFALIWLLSSPIQLLASQESDNGEYLRRLKTELPDGKHVGVDKMTGNSCTIEIHSTDDGIRITNAELSQKVSFQISVRDNFRCRPTSPPPDWFQCVKSGEAPDYITYTLEYGKPMEGPENDLIVIVDQDGHDGQLGMIPCRAHRQ